MHHQIHPSNVGCSIPVAAGSEVWTCGCSLAETAGSNPAGCTDVSCVCCVLASRGLRDGPIARPEESTERGVCECDPETWTVGRSRPAGAVKP